MVRNAERAFLSVPLLTLAAGLFAQPGQSTFAYTGEDAILDALDQHHVHFGGFSNSVLVEADEEGKLVWPWLPAIFYEYNYLLLPSNKGLNVSLGATPEINLFPLFMGRVSGLAELTLGAESHNKPGKGAGLRFGAGFTALGSTFGFTESSPVLRAGVLFNNIRVTYMYALAEPIYINHQVMVAIKLDL